MWIVREIGRGLAVVSLTMFLVALAPPRGWASEGGGGIEYYYSDDEDDDKVETLEATPERSAYLAPTNYDFSFRPRYTFANDWTLRASYSYSVEESTEEPTVFTTKYSYPANILVRPEYRYRWRFPESDYMDADEDDGEDESASTPSNPKIRYKFSTWVSFETLEVLDEEEESGTTYSFGLDLTDEQRENLERGFEMLVRQETRKRVAKWLGDGVAEKFQERFGLAADDAGAEDQSGWNDDRIYCGGTCTGRYY